MELDILERICEFLRFIHEPKVADSKIQQFHHEQLLGYQPEQELSQTEPLRQQHLQRHKLHQQHHYLQKIQMHLSDKEMAKHQLQFQYHMEFQFQSFQSQRLRATATRQQQQLHYRKSPIRYQLQHPLFHSTQLTSKEHQKLQICRTTSSPPSTSGCYDDSWRTRRSRRRSSEVAHGTTLQDVALTCERDGHIPWTR